MVTNDGLKFRVCFQKDNDVAFHVQPANEYEPEFTGKFDIQISEVGFLLI